LQDGSPPAQNATGLTAFRNGRLILSDTAEYDQALLATLYEAASAEVRTTSYPEGLLGLPAQ